MVKISEEKKKETEKYVFKDELTGFDIYNGLNKEDRESMLSVVKMAASASVAPKLSVNQVFGLPYKEFRDFIKAFKDKYKITKEDFLG